MGRIGKYQIEALVRIAGMSGDLPSFDQIHERLGIGRCLRLADSLVARGLAEWDRNIFVRITDDGRRVAEKSKAEKD